MRKLLITSLFIIGLLTIVPSLRGEIFADSLQFDQPSYSTSLNSTFQVQVIVNPGSDQITSVDAYIIFDPTLLSAQSVAAGSYFPTVTNNITSGQVYIAGMVSDPAMWKTGTGTIATITFTGLKNGSGTLSYLCSSNSTPTSKIIKNDPNAPNIINCTQNGTSNVTVGAGGSSSSSSNGGGSSSSNSSSGGGGGGLNITPTGLPKTGSFTNLNSITISGAVLLIVGAVAKLVL